MMRMNEIVDRMQQCQTGREEEKKIVWIIDTRLFREFDHSCSKGASDPSASCDIMVDIRAEHVGVSSSPIFDQVADDLHRDRTNLSNAISDNLPADLGFTIDSVNTGTIIYSIFFTASKLLTSRPPVLAVVTWDMWMRISC